MKLQNLVAAVLLVLTTCLNAQAYQLTLTPAIGDLSGSPGAVVGWGYTITNDSADWMVVTDSRFDNLETWFMFTGFVARLDPATATIAPGGSLTQNFSYSVVTPGYPPALSGTGIGAVAIDPSAPVPSQATGNVVIVYDTYGDNGGIMGDQIGFSLDAVADVQGKVAAGQGTTAVPEPSTYALLCISLGVVGYARRRMAAGER